ncbi:single-stranded DNA-binding protein [Helicobacter sp. MIT 05-5294]|uniref:single-stranded DNA-binding protein n=1 Tax=Helicobacter sp. MIT 05-5294 TaxID=1548150 RepID=UPI00051FC9BE|nr:single-stranded DNA-binding protein [Helicobacter sp. MIT 05-5294]TLD85553.1 single-stranded DNA-binding protein [Helicobacter sp. MIT 05-5294]
MNIVTICGNLGADFEVKDTKSGGKVARNSVAITEKHKADNGDTIEHTDWIPIVIFGKKAETASTYLRKGDKFLGNGKIYTYTYDDENGNKKYGWQVIIQNFTFVNQKREIPNPPQVVAEVVYENVPQATEEAQTLVNSEAEQETPF